MAKLNRLVFAFVLVFVLIAPALAYAEKEEVEEINGENPYNAVVGSGQTVSIGAIADLTLDPSMAYLDAENTRKFLDDNGNISSDSDIGAVYPMDSNWIVYFQYFDDGHIKDDEKDNIDADALLESYKKGTENQNSKLENPTYHLFVEGWERAPDYDEVQRALTWTLRMHTSNNEPLLNQNVRILTREGNMSVILVTDPGHLQEDAASMKQLVLDKLNIKPGQRYEDFNESTDKKASYGLTGLILGGAGLVVAKKAGLIAVIVVLVKKFGIVIVAAVAGLWRFLRGKSNTKNNDNRNNEPSNTSPDQSQDTSVPSESNRM
ncbi:DUF2167 domain-containing protein [Cohnella abietis]|uniref:Membrane protein n=1 Tax=Cohnella abietis TaxID=2507935 RepID=A0A3T1D983_9BACL|nr:DUF2167 domain-containing protein [Cohnella abietis]BBI34643.1 membrane protein [Cohnella abietis]